MGRLLAFLIENRATVLFVILQGISFWLLIQYNQRPAAVYLNSSSQVVASVNASSRSFSDYFELKNINEKLLLENESLKLQLLQPHEQDTTIEDSVHSFKLTSARVIDNSFRKAQNYFTISKGSSDGVAVGMGVISSSGVAGQVKSVSKNFATVYSVLYPKLSISSQVKPTGTLCTTQWGQKDYQTAGLKFVPRHVLLAEGDSVVTSGFNAVFPEGIFIGTVSSIQLQDDKTFYDAEIKLATDFSSLHYVYVIENLYKSELDSLHAL